MGLNVVLTHLITMLQKTRPRVTGAGQDNGVVFVEGAITYIRVIN